MTTTEYERGYNNGYRAGRRYRESSYRRVDWRCGNCGVVGVTLRHSSDSAAKFQWRLDQSHHSRNKHCAMQNIIPISRRQLAAERKD